MDSLYLYNTILILYKINYYLSLIATVEDISFNCKKIKPYQQLKKHIGHQYQTIYVFPLTVKPEHIQAIYLLLFEQLL